MKKIIVLVMSCNEDFFIKHEQLIRDTWANEIFNGKYPNIDFYSYTSSDDGKYHLNKHTHIISVPCDDGLHGTAEKTVKCLKALSLFNIEYDIIFRTNTSTYINIPLLNEFLQNTYNPITVWAGISFASPTESAPYEYCLYARGSAVALTKTLVEQIISNENIINAFEMDEVRNDLVYQLDDTFVFGLLINAYIFNHCMNMMKIYRTFGVVSVPREVSLQDNVMDKLALSIRVYNDDYIIRDYLETRICVSVKNCMDANYIQPDLSCVYEYVNDDFCASSIHDLKKQTLTEKLIEFGKIPYLEN